MKAVRRVVTGVNEKGQSAFIQDEGREDLFGGQGMEGFTDQGQLAMADLWMGTLPANNAADNFGEHPGEYNLDPIPGR